MSNYENIIFMDLDLLFLDNISPLINEMVSDDHIDIMACKGGYVKEYEQGKVHTVRDEILKDGLKKIKLDFNSINFNSQAINTGLLLIKGSSMKRNENNILKLLNNIKYYKYYDQTMINILISSNLLQLKLFSPMYNLVIGGILLKNRNESTRIINNENGTCEVLYKKRNKHELRPKVIHFAGPHKPWTVVNPSRNRGCVIWNKYKNIKI